MMKDLRTFVGLLFILIPSFSLLLGFASSPAWAGENVTEELLLLDCDGPKENFLMPKSVIKVLFPRYIYKSTIRVQLAGEADVKIYIYHSATLDKEAHLTVHANEIAFRKGKAVVSLLRVEVDRDGEGSLYFDDVKQTDVNCRVIIGSI